MQSAENLPCSTPSGFALGRGVNISHWLSQVGDRPPRRTSLFSELDAHFLRHSGFDHIRLPIDEIELWDDSGAPLDDGFNALRAALQWCLRAGLRCIVDLHTVRSHHFNAAHDGGENTLWTDPAAQDRFIDLWQQLSERIGDLPADSVAYEFMNEAVADDPEDWNRLVDRVHREMRQREPERTFVVGSNRWQSLDTFEQLRLPESDRNLILSFHFYEPFLVTHFHTSWTPLAPYRGPVHYPGVPYPPDAIKAVDDASFQAFAEGANDTSDREALQARIARAQAFARNAKRPLYCGEWGCFIEVPRTARLAWYRDMTAIFTELGVAQAIWDYKGSFRIVDEASQAVDHALVDILTT